MSDAQADRIIKAVNANTAALLVYGYNSGGVKHPGIAAVVEENQRRITGIPAAVWNTPVKRGSESLPALQDLVNGSTAAQQIAAKPATAPALDVKALAAEIAAHLTTDQAHQFIVALGQALPKE